MKKRSNLFLIVGVIMLIVAICFVIFALNNPQASFPWNNMITFGIYIIYFVTTVFFIGKGAKKL